MKTKTISIRLEPRQVKRLKEEAKRANKENFDIERGEQGEKVSVSKIIRYLIDKEFPNIFS